MDTSLGELYYHYHPPFTLVHELVGGKGISKLYNYVPWAYHYFKYFKVGLLNEEGCEVITSCVVSLTCTTCKHSAVMCGICLHTAFPC